jgi:hypothetical protein
MNMKKLLLVASCLLAFNFSSVSFADDAHPCKNLETACKAAGFYKGGSDSGKGLYKDCIEPIANGKTIAGITVEKADIDSCKAKIDTMK